ncbi:MAG: flavin-dependent monooxygenase [Rhodospirillales bacterium]|nr:flavin-dependent monooxygenase [Rhodospirillales bacterium]MBT5114046.1 flavin-dependent monooxygenase [Rhodospirillales bacterium]MBT5672574.1 flavin-dependent monooxygenase [Rhodospirillales bacterium]MBT6185756.1 flavin-dependent monooxygenase [Rhodospirillales bacterium]MBT6743084.1 flavin-dependent monooxygenase [Rhodospirillales bacterium]
MTGGNPKPTPDELLDRARALVPLLREKAASAEDARMVSKDVMAALREADLFHILQPERFGGYEYDFSCLMKISCVLGAGCASTAWVAGLAIMHQWLVANFPLQAQEDVWGDAPNAITFGSYSPITEAEAVDGGWRISGSWPFSSGCDHGQWALLGVRIADDAGGDKPVIAFVLVPAKDYKIEDDWFTTALSATGSKRIVCKDVFVPSHRRLDLEDAKAGTSPGAKAQDRPLYRIPMFSCIPTAITGPALGALKGALDDFIDLNKTRKTLAMAGGRSMAGFAGVQTRVAEATAAYDAARLMILRDLKKTNDVVNGGGAVDLDMRMRNRLTHSYILKLCVGAIDGLYSVTGVTGTYEDNRVGRAWRDIHAISHHISLNWDAGSTMYGSYALGLDPHGQF